MFPHEPLQQPKCKQCHAQLAIGGKPTAKVSLRKVTQQKVRHLIQVHNLLILSKLGIHCGKPSVYLILDFLLEVSIILYSI